MRNTDCNGWPHAQAVRTKCVRDDFGRLHPPAFSDGCGPIGMYAMIASRGACACCGQAMREANVHTLRWCASAFDEFLEAACEGLDADKARLLRRGCHFASEESWHTCVSIFHEHPSMLSAEERVDWRPVDLSLEAALSSKLRERLKTMAAPLLSLDSLLITKDGALIAGFVDDERGAFGALREAATALGQLVIGGRLTSRPKRLIHVTLGRVLDCPPLDDVQRTHVEHTVRRFNQHVLPARVRSRASTLLLSTVSFARDTVWWMTEYKEMETIILRSPE
uniref:Uncharacterized protein n=1 Tax=Calcidiscus leptoporus TaxID=127549 RepID=A0A7S0NV09_9EUKA